MILKIVAAVSCILNDAMVLLLKHKIKIKQKKIWIFTYCCILSAPLDFWLC